MVLYLFQVLKSVIVANGVNLPADYCASFGLVDVLIDLDKIDEALKDAKEN